MNALTPVASRLMKLIPLLASNYDGEVLATVAAVRKVLDGAGLNFHDFAAAIEPPQHKPHATVNRVDDFDAMFAEIHQHNRLNGTWNRTLWSIEEIWRRTGHLSPGNVNLLRRGYETVTANVYKGFTL